MHQHITKLVRQALKECVSTPVESVIASSIDDHGIVEIPNTFAEKFAELIVLECIGIAQDHSAFYWEPPNNVNHTINKIRQHFGVEE